MVESTGCDGVVVGRGCLGRPWLFGDLAAAFEARAQGVPFDDERSIRPNLGHVLGAMRRHTELLAEFFDSEERACRDIRKHVSWYFKGYPVGADTRRALALVESLAEMDALFETLDWNEPYPGTDAEGPRGRAGSPKRTVLPEHWLDSRTLDGVDLSELALAERDDSGG